MREVRSVSATTVEGAEEEGGRSGSGIAGGAGSGARGGRASSVAGEVEEVEEEAVALTDAGGTSGRISRLVRPELGHFQERELREEGVEKRVSVTRRRRRRDLVENEQFSETFPLLDGVIQSSNRLHSFSLRLPERHEADDGCGKERRVAVEVGRSAKHEERPSEGEELKRYVPVRTPQAGCQDPAWKEVSPSIQI